jgi:hypothetical protein
MPCTHCLIKGVVTGAGWFFDHLGAILRKRILIGMFFMVMQSWQEQFQYDECNVI